MSDVPLQPEEIHFHPTSFCDRHGRVFTWRGDLYRALTEAGATLFRQMSESGLLPHLIEKGMLIATEATDLRVEGCALVVRHRRIPFVSLPEEWSPAMLRDAALLLAELELELHRHGLGLNENDIAFSNVLFDGCRPVFVDLGSIRPSAGIGRESGPEFERSCVFFLRLLASGQPRLARALLADENSAAADELQASRRGGALSRWRRPAGLKDLAEELRSLRLPEPAAPSIEPHVSDLSWLEKLAPRSALVLGERGASMIEPLMKEGCNVVFADPNEALVDWTYGRHPSANLFPVVLDFRYPSPGRGVNNRELAPATERLRAELVLADGLVERMVFEQFLSFDQIAATLTAFTGRELLVSFLPPESAELQAKVADAYFAWYRLENLERSLAALFPQVETRPSGGEGRFLLHCRA